MRKLYIYAEMSTWHLRFFVAGWKKAKNFLVVRDYLHTFANEILILTKYNLIMKKLFVVGCMMLGMSAVHAQNIFSHVGVGAGIGTTGVTLDLGTDITDYFTVRGGLDIFPSVKMDFDVKPGYESALPSGVSTTGYNIPKEVTIQGKTGLGAGHLLVDIHPFRNAFRITAGLYFGQSKIITVENKEDKDFAGIVAWNETKAGTTIGGKTLPRVGVQLGDYFLEPEKTTEGGHLDASIKVKDVRPYIGIGFGRLIPKNSRVTCNFDLGVQFWNTPEIYLNGKNGEKKLEKSDLNGDGDKTLDALSKITVYPCLTFRIVGRIF